MNRGWVVTEKAQAALQRDGLDLFVLIAMLDKPDKDVRDPMDGAVHHVAGSGIAATVNTRTRLILTVAKLDAPVEKKAPTKRRPARRYPVTTVRAAAPVEVTPLHAQAAQGLRDTLKGAAPDEVRVVARNVVEMDFETARRLGLV